MEFFLRVNVAVIPNFLRIATIYKVFSASVFLFLLALSIYPACATDPKPVSIDSGIGIAHPILGVSGSIGGTVLDGLTFKKLNRSNDPVSDDVRFEKFRKVENETAVQFCQLAKLSSPEELESCVGTPRAKLRNIECWSDVQSQDENWLFYFGLTGIPIRVVFRDNKCVDAFIYSYVQDLQLQYWLAKQICLFSNNNNKVSAITAKYGTPYAVIETSSELPPLEAFQVGAQQPAKQYSKMMYATGKSTCAMLYVDGEKCLNAKVSGIGH